MNSPSSSSPALTGRGWSFGGTRLQREGSSQLAIAADRAAAVEDPPDAVDLTEAQLEAFVGHWRASMGIEVEIVREDEGLVFIQAGTRARLVAAAPDRILLRAANIDMRLSDLRDGRFHSMSVAQNGQAFSAERFNPRPEPERDPALYRSYYSEELDVTYSVYDKPGPVSAGPAGGLPASGWTARSAVGESAGVCGVGPRAGGATPARQGQAPPFPCAFR
jgi:hypothetical protein